MYEELTPKNTGMASDSMRSYTLGKAYETTISTAGTLHLEAVYQDLDAAGTLHLEAGHQDLDAAGALHLEAEHQDLDAAGAGNAINNQVYYLTTCSAYEC